MTSATRTLGSATRTCLLPTRPKTLTAQIALLFSLLFALGLNLL